MGLEVDLKSLEELLEAFGLEPETQGELLTHGDEFL